ncbi:MAG: hypothetical protein KBT06_03005, partial [Prevotellaceae bacterium]|nr:hypothetical protein [Candidatus Colivivens equi]
ITKILKTKTEGFIDTFTIYYDDSTEESFELLNGKHTARDYNLFLYSYYMPEPEPKVERVDLPFSSGSIDLTEATGIVPYKDREGLEFKFILKDGNAENFANIVQSLSMFLHGKYLKMIVDHDTSYYYMVRLNVDPKKTNARNSEIVLTGVADPFKYNLLASNEPWEWNPFSFVSGVIQDTSDITVNGEKEIEVMAGGIPTCPEFYVSKIETTLSVVFDDITYKFASGAGSYRFPQIRISGDDAVIKFVGKGKVSLAYRGRFL